MGAETQARPFKNAQTICSKKVRVCVCVFFPVLSCEFAFLYNPYKEFVQERHRPPTPEDRAFLLHVACT